MKLFRIFKSEGEPLAVAMAGVKLGDRLLMLGCGDPRLVAQLAVKTGLTGRAFAADARADLARAAEELAPREGALIETATAAWTALPLDASTFDVAVIRHVFPDLAGPERIACAVEVHRVLRPGGRCLTIDPGQVSGLGGLITRLPGNPQYNAQGGAVAVLEAAGFRGARLLAEREGTVFCEAARPNG
jgi:ubiquinone/menaquinone biosynthesis C-methylase UbiE